MRFTFCLCIRLKICSNSVCILLFSYLICTQALTKDNSIFTSAKTLQLILWFRCTVMQSKSIALNQIISVLIYFPVLSVGHNFMCSVVRYSECRNELYNEQTNKTHYFQWIGNTKIPTATAAANNIKYIQIKLENKPLYE